MKLPLLRRGTGQRQFVAGMLNWRETES
jgi:hypothetical protein